jgi:hypothetical protein
VPYRLVCSTKARSPMPGKHQKPKLKGTNRAQAGGGRTKKPPNQSLSDRSCPTETRRDETSTLEPQRSSPNPRASSLEPISETGRWQSKRQRWPKLNRSPASSPARSPGKPANQAVSHKTRSSHETTKPRRPTAQRPPHRHQRPSTSRARAHRTTHRS